jgi:hypothetical protein
MSGVKDKCVALLVALLMLAVAAQAQYANDWINYNQTYFKIPVSKDGVYKLSYSDLLNAGFPVNAVDPRFIQLYHRGKEQAIYVKGQADAVFNSTDYIQFYGKKNDGTLDSLLYRPASAQPHKYHNLYSDTTAYFLTYTLSPPRGMRMDSVQLVNVGNLPAQSYQYAQRLLVLSSNYMGGYTAADVTQATYFDVGEGWSGQQLQQGGTVDYVIDSVYNGVPAAGNPQIEIQLMGLDNITHGVSVLVGSGLRTLANISFTGFSTYTIKADLNWSDVASDGTVHVRIAAQSATTNRYQVSTNYIKVTFPQSFDFANQKKKAFTLEVNPGGQSFVSITNAGTGMQLWDVTDATNIVRIQPSVSGSTVSSVIPGTSVAKKLLAFTSVITPKIMRISFRQIDPTASNYIIISHKVLMKPALTYGDVVKAFAGYRASAAGGKYDTLVVTVDQLYNQFNYGELSPAAIYAFMKWMVEKGSPKYLLLLGKGKDVFSFSPYRNIALQANEKYDYVPSAGFPGGDIAFTAGLKGTTFDPAVATGRLPASTPLQIANYLNKVIELESKPMQPWAKELLHLSGGFHDATELATFRSYVDGFKAIAEGIYLGGNVTTKSKTDIGLEKIDAEENINKGTNLVTFFGHSSSSVTDIDIGFVTDPALSYSNAGKYPVFLINGCNSGTVFTDQVTFGEDWIMAAGKGARNFIASTSFSFEIITRNYSTEFYQVAFADSAYIKKGIGEIQREAVKRFLANYGENVYTQAIAQQMLLTGDPALKLFGTAVPDYAVDNGAISLTSLDNAPVTSLSTSFALKIIVKNLGAVNTNLFRLRVIRTFNDNTTKTYDSLYAPVYYTDTLLFKIKNENGVSGFGNNLFTVVVNPLGEIKEVSQSNNSATLSYFIPSNGTLNLYPPPFGIVSSTAVNFLFQDSNLMGSQRNFQFQLDTVKTFTSPFLTTATVSGKVLAKKSLTLLSTDSTVYYWRTKPVKQSATDSADWMTSSFVYINQSPEGWAQTKFEQITSDSIGGLSQNALSRTFDYLQSQSTIDVKSIGASSGSPYTNASIKVDGIEYNLIIQGLQCRQNTINLMAFDKSSLVPYPGISFSYNDLRSCGRMPKVINSFSYTEVETGNGDDLMQYVDNIGASDSVVVFSIGNPGYSLWSSNVLNKMGNLGIAASQITSLQDGEPVIIFARKGAPAGTATVYRSATTPAVNQDLSVSKKITGKFSSAKIKSVSIGPARKWIKFVPQVTDVQATDVAEFTIYGADLKGNQHVIASHVKTALDLSFVDPAVYPVLRVELSMEDAINLSPVKLRHWFVFFESVADGLLYYEGPAEAQTVQEGEVFTGKYGFVNISGKSFTDSLQVKSTLASSANVSSNQFKIKAPAPGDTTKFALTVNTVGKVGTNDVTVFVNPRVQPEQYYENNVIDLAGYLKVNADHSAPALVVTVDGRYLRNGDFVSPSPAIRIRIHDENKFYFVTDTTKLTVLLSYPCATETCAFTRINFSRNDVTWSPATASSDFEFSFSPQQLAEGTYTLQVIAWDASGNRSGATPYEISFAVKEATTLALSSVYPNPSHDYFNFGFVLSGNVLPDDFSLQIFSAEGKLLQDFSKADVSGFVIGTNVLTWRASGESGLLIYRLTVRANGKSVTQSGKLSLIR